MFSFSLKSSEEPQVNKNAVKMIFYYTIFQNCYLTANVAVAVTHLHGLAHAPGPGHRWQGRAAGVSHEQAASHLLV